jgi:hypothetical protein
MAHQQYRLVVKGELGRRYASAFEGMTVSAHDGVTDITGQIADPAQLQGLIDRIAALGLTLHSLTPVEPDAEEPSRASPSTAFNGT